MQEREKTRCKSDMAYHCATHDTQWLDDESDRCEYIANVKRGDE